MRRVSVALVKAEKDGGWVYLKVSTLKRLYKLSGASKNAVKFWDKVSGEARQAYPVSPLHLRSLLAAIKISASVRLSKENKEGE